jgi:hypothetical protein
VQMCPTGICRAENGCQRQRKPFSPEKSCSLRTFIQTDCTLAYLCDSQIRKLIFFVLIFVPCILPNVQKSPTNALIIISLLFHSVPPTWFGTCVPSSGRSSGTIYSAGKCHLSKNVSCNRESKPGAYQYVVSASKRAASVGVFVFAVSIRCIFSCLTF